MMSSLTLSVQVASRPEDVHAFVSDPKHLPHWARGLCKGVRREGEAWIVTTTRGEARIQFAPPNPFGVLDHVVSPAPGVEIHVPMRVVRNEQGSEVLFTLFRHPSMSEEQFADDAERVRADLEALRRLLEGGDGR